MDAALQNTEYWLSGPLEAKFAHPWRGINSCVFNSLFVFQEGGSYAS